MSNFPTPADERDWITSRLLSAAKAIALTAEGLRRDLAKASPEVVEADTQHALLARVNEIERLARTLATAGKARL